jgi:hypothetical protein
MTNNKMRSRLSEAKWPISMLAIGLMLILPNTAKCQTVTGSGSQNRIPKWSGATPTSSQGDSAITDSSGNIGIGTTNPVRKVEIADSLYPGIRLTHTAVGSFLLYVRNPGFREFSIFDDNALVDRLVIDSNGRVGIGTVEPSSTLHVFGDLTLTGTGNISASGNIAAKYQDVAEWVPASGAIGAGTVVVLDSERSNHVIPSARAYDTRVAGVVSANPGLILGERGNGKVMVATTGRVKMRVDATAAPIRVGDLLVTSDKEGVAMRSVPLDLGGTPIHRPGTLIGKALEPLEAGVGEILVLLSLQ